MVPLYMNTLKKKNISQLIIDNIVDKINSKEWTPGTKLPNEKDLAANYGVSRVPVREALRSLETLGLLTTKHGEGTFVNVFSTEHLGLIFRLFFLLDDSPVSEILYLRKLLETEAARLAAKNATIDQIQTINEKMVLREQALASGEPLQNIHDADTAFHRSIFEASGNGLLVHLIRAISQAMANHQHDASMVPVVLNNVGLYHEAIVTAIKSRDAELAAKKMQLHMEQIENGIRGSIM